MFIGHTLPIPTNWFSSTNYNPQLLDAIKANDTGMVRTCLAAGADANYDGDWTRPLNFAVKFGYVQMVQILLDAGAGVNTPDFIGWTPLFEAVSHGKEEIVEILIAAGADVNTKREGRSLLFYIPKDCVRISRLLLNAGLEIDADVLGTVTRNSYVGQVKALLAAGADVNGKGDKRGIPPPLFYAVLRSTRNVALVRILLAANADVHATFTSLDRRTNLLCTAAKHGIVKAVKALLAAGADVNASPDPTGRTALFHAVEENDIAMAQVLLSAGANSGAKFQGKTVREYAIEKGNPEMIRIFKQFCRVTKRG